MIDPNDQRFFAALSAECDRTDGLDPAVTKAVARAAETADPLDLQAAMRALDGVAEPVKSGLLRAVHLRMATDLSAIWDAMPAADGKQRPN